MACTYAKLHNSPNKCHAASVGTPSVSKYKTFNVETQTSHTGGPSRVSRLGGSTWLRAETPRGLLEWCGLPRCAGVGTFLCVGLHCN
uniref:Uncharacterized protein n=1 Tax=Aegilops tauschii subsp. strangulata TaxID=200361 RepID=A0A453DAQ1_AEGTS